MSFTNAQLAQQMADMIEHWSGFAEEYSDWLAGAVDGGPGSDGSYPLTDWYGTEYLVASPAKLADNVSGYVGLASASEAAAAASAAAAATSESNAASSASAASTDASAAAASAAAAAVDEGLADSSATVATAQANLATDRAGYAQEWANAAEDVLVTAAAGGDLVDDYSALHHATKAAASAAAALVSETNAAASEAAAATFDPALYAALADNETITGGWIIENSTSGLTFKKAADADTGQIHYDGASLWLKNNRAGGSIYADCNTFNVLNSGNFTLSGGIAVVQTADTLSSMYYRAQSDHVYIDAVGNANHIRLKVAGTEYARVDTGGIDVTGALAATGAVTGSNLNVSNWDTAYGWGDHAGLYAPITNDFALTTGDTFTGATYYNAIQYINWDNGSIRSPDETYSYAIIFGNSWDTSINPIIRGFGGSHPSAPGQLEVGAATDATLKLVGQDVVVTCPTEMQDQLKVKSDATDYTAMFTNTTTTGLDSIVVIEGNRNNPSVGTQPAQLRFRTYDQDDTLTYELGRISMECRTVDTTHLYEDMVFEVRSAGATFEEVMALEAQSGVGVLHLGVEGTTYGGVLELHGTTASKTSTIKCTNGNLHIDSETGSSLYLNYYEGGTIYFGTGASGTRGYFNSLGLTLTNPSTLRFNDANTYISEGTDNQVRLGTDHGYMDIGPQNTSYCHLATDIGNGFYTAEGFHFNGQMRRYNKGAYLHHASSSYAASGVGAITFSTSAASGGSSGDIWFQYT